MQADAEREAAAVVVEATRGVAMATAVAADDCAISLVQLWVAEERKRIMKQPLETAARG